MSSNKFSFGERMNNWQEYQRYLLERIIDRAEKHRSNGDLKKAINCCEGFLERYNTEQTLHNYMGNLYYENGDLLNAGRHFYFKQDLTETEAACVRSFEKRYGNSSLLIAKKLLYKECYRISKLDDYTKQKLYQLVKDALAEAKTTPKFLKGAKQHFEKIYLK